MLVQEIEQSFAVLPWSLKLRNKKALEEKHGARIGYRYNEDEHRGIFRSNDPQVPVRRMVRSVGVLVAEDLARASEVYRAARMMDY